MPKITRDYPRLRAQDTCPLCGASKGLGPIVCWGCFEKSGLDEGEVNVVATLDVLEGTI